MMCNFSEVYNKKCKEPQTVGTGCERAFVSLNANSDSVLNGIALYNGVDKLYCLLI